MKLEDVNFLKMFAVWLVDIGISKDDPRLRRLVVITKQAEADSIPDIVTGEPDADSPALLRDRLVDIVFKSYVGSCPSKVKANHVVSQILETLEAFYEDAAEVAEAGGVN